MMQTHEHICESIVASPEPPTPILKVKINSGSSAIFITAPRSTEHIAVIEYPCVKIKGFSP